jgi:catechol 2,3-dioxygenase-like lactoylglutathione lyase family enzyme
MVEHEGTRIQLQSTDTTPAAAEDIRIDVTGIEATCAAARAHGGEVVEPPAPSTGADGRRRWRARLRDPDGHGIELSEYRDE